MLISGLKGLRRTLQGGDMAEWLPARALGL